MAFSNSGTLFPAFCNRLPAFPHFLCIIRLCFWRLINNPVASIFSPAFTPAGGCHALTCGSSYRVSRDFTSVACCHSLDTHWTISRVFTLLSFRKFKVALNRMYRIFVDFAKSCILSCLSKFYKEKIHRVVFEL